MGVFLREMCSVRCKYRNVSIFLLSIPVTIHPFHEYFFFQPIFKTSQICNIFCPFFVVEFLVELDVTSTGFVVLCCVALCCLSSIASSCLVLCCDVSFLLV